MLDFRTKRNSSKWIKSCLESRKNTFVKIKNNFQLHPKSYGSVQFFNVLKMFRIENKGCFLIIQFFDLQLHQKGYGLRS